MRKSYNKGKLNSMYGKDRSVENSSIYERYHQGKIKRKTKELIIGATIFMSLLYPPAIRAQTEETEQKKSID